MVTIGRHVSKLSGYAPALPTLFDADYRGATAARQFASAVSGGDD